MESDKVVYNKLKFAQLVIISLRKQTYLTFTMDFNLGRGSPGF